MNYIKLEHYIIFFDKISFIHFKYLYGSIDKIEIHYVGGEIFILETYLYDSLKTQLQKMGVEL